MFYRNSQFSILSSENTIRNATKIQFFECYEVSAGVLQLHTIRSGPNNILQNYNYPLVCDYSDFKSTIIRLAYTIPYRVNRCVLSSVV